MPKTLQDGKLQIYCEDCGQERLEGRTIRGYCKKHLKEANEKFAAENPEDNQLENREFN